MSEIRNSAERKGDEQMELAKKKLSAFGWFGLNDSSKKEDAAQCYMLAGAQYKIAQAWEKAGGAYAAAADLHLGKLNNRTDGIQALCEAGRAYKNTQGAAAIKAMTQAARMMMEDNRFAPAAKLWAEIGDTENDQNLDRRAAYTAYVNAADSYRAANSAITAQSMQLKGAEMLSLEGEYERAMVIYETIADAQADNASVAWSARDNLYKALLCQMTLEAVSEVDALVATEEKLEKYLDNHPRFQDSKEANLVRDLILAYNARDQQRFVGVLHKYDSIYRLDAWSQALLYKVKKTVSGEAPITATGEDGAVKTAADTVDLG
jgi:alpha-soluble NSF attachment protein